VRHSRGRHATVSYHGTRAAQRKRERERESERANEGEREREKGEREREEPVQKHSLATSSHMTPLDKRSHNIYIYIYIYAHVQCTRGV